MCCPYDVYCMYIQMPSTVVGSRQAKRGGGEALVLYMIDVYICWRYDNSTIYDGSS